MGRSEGPTRISRPRPLRWPTTEVVHGPGPRSFPGSASDGRALQRAGPTVQWSSRGFDHELTGALYDRDRHPQPRASPPDR